MRETTTTNQEVQREIFTESEVSTMLGISTVTLWRERKAGRIRFRKIGSKIGYTRADIDAYKEAIQQN